MAQHKLPHGRRLITALSDFGDLLGYHVEREYPVDAVDRGDPPAVDVAWFSEKGQKFPLMIFEVESAAGNTIANNPLKVFGQLTSNFEKPLFYFQILASRGSETTRLRYLQTQYGTHNYRIYRIGEDEGTLLVNDILSQHRRIRNHVDYVGLFEMLSGENWRGVSDSLAILRHAYTIGLSPYKRLPSYVRLARIHPDVLEDLKSMIREEVEVHDWQHTASFGSYVGGQWAPLLLCSFMIGQSVSTLESEWWDRAMCRWQNEATDIPMLVAHLGLGYDYSEFLLGLSAPLVTLCAAAASEPTPCLFELAGVLRELLDQLEPGWHGFQVAVWLAHFAAWTNNNELFEAARIFITSAGGLSTTLLMSPPSSVSVVELQREEVFPQGGEVPCPGLTAFRSMATDHYAGHPRLDAKQLALQALDDDSFFFSWAEPILASMWAPR